MLPGSSTASIFRGGRRRSASAMFNTTLLKPRRRHSLGQVGHLDFELLAPVVRHAFGVLPKLHAPGGSDFVGLLPNVL